jgi:hypothetical protein
MIGQEIKLEKAVYILNLVSSHCHTDRKHCQQAQLQADNEWTEQERQVMQKICKKNAKFEIFERIDIICWLMPLFVRMYWGGAKLKKTYLKCLF